MNADPALSENKFHKCDPEILLRFRDGTATPADEQFLEQHLRHCHRCAGELDGLLEQDPLVADCRDMINDDGFDTELSIAMERKGNVSSKVTAALGNFLTKSELEGNLGQIGSFEVSEVIGVGGMGVVLKGHDASLEREVAIKVLSPELIFSPKAKHYFVREGRAAASVSHPNVISIHQVSEQRGLPYLVMPYLGRETLQTRIDQNGPLDVPAILGISRDIALGLAAAHEQNLIHRDIKPSNILIEHETGRIVICDFGLARMTDAALQTEASLLAGTPCYMSPEQASGNSLDCRSDLYSLGSLMYAMCTGFSPHQGENSLGTLRSVADSEPTPITVHRPEIPSWLVRFVKILHAKDPEHRIQSASQVDELLAQCQKHLKEPSRFALPELLEPRKSKIVPGSLLYAGISGLIIVALATLWAAGNWHVQIPSNEALRTEPAKSVVASTESEPRLPSLFSGGSHRSDSTLGIFADGDRQLSLHDMLLRYKEAPRDSEHQQDTSRRIGEQYDQQLRTSDAQTALAIRAQWAAVMMPFVLGELPDHKAGLFMQLSEPISETSNPRLASAASQASSLTDLEMRVVHALACARKSEFEIGTSTIQSVLNDVSAFASRQGSMDTEATFFGDRMTCRAILNQCRIYEQVISALSTNAN